MLETSDWIILHTPKCGGCSLEADYPKSFTGRRHDGLFALSKEQRKKQIYALTRNLPDWYQSLFQFITTKGSYWVTEFGITKDFTTENFSKFLHIATVDPPKRQKNRFNRAVSVPFDSFAAMVKRGYGFWSFWHEFLSSEDPENLGIHPDVSFIPIAHPDFFIKHHHNSTKKLQVVWTYELLKLLEVDTPIKEIVDRQTIV